MTPEKVLEVIHYYRQRFKELGVDTLDYPHEKPLRSPDLGLAHCHGMLDEMEAFVKEGRMDKCFRWLGFIQGFLWSQGLYTLTDLKNHNSLEPLGK